jgi:hypothetical protein
VARVILSADMQRYTDGIREITVSAGKYRDLVTELLQRFPGMNEAIVAKHALAIDGIIIQTPLLETFGEDSELVFVARIAGG